MKIIDKNIAEKTRGLYRNPNKGNEWRDIPQEKADLQALTDEQIIELSELIIKIENHYGFPVDIEWAIEKGKFYIVQSRPITTLSKPESKKIKPLEKFLTRDAPLIALEYWWHRGCTEAFPAFFGFSFPRTFIVKKNSLFTAYWDTSMLEDYLKGFSHWLKYNPQKTILIHKRLYTGLRFFRKVKTLKKDTTIYKLVEELKKAINFFFEGLPAVDAVHVLPGLHDQLQKDNKSLFNDIQINKLTTWREKEGNFFFNEGVNAFYFLLDLIGEKKGWQKNLLKYITYTELIDVLKMKRPFPKEDLLRRRDAKFIFIDGNIIFDPVIEQTLHSNGYFLMQEDVPSTNKIIGTTAMPGKIRGICRLIFERSQLDCVGTGEILVAPMTSPWYMPAMKRTGAIITDEGGITCHAAIISRELKKPCIIGTKIATQVLHDGDLVEVDANEGTVKILERQK